MIKIEEIIFLIDNIPHLLGYIVYGFAFLYAFEWASFNVPSSEFNTSIFKSIIINYVIVGVYNRILSIWGQNIDDYIAIFSIISFTLGIFIGKFYRSKTFNDILRFFNIGRTTNECIWSDLIQDGAWYRIYEDSGESYLGQMTKAEPFTSEPIIALFKYQKLDADGNILIDHFEEEHEVILLNTKDFKKIEITYPKKNKCKLFSKRKE